MEQTELTLQIQIEGLDLVSDAKSGEKWAKCRIDTDESQIVLRIVECPMSPKLSTQLAILNNRESPPFGELIKVKEAFYKANMVNVHFNETQLKGIQSDSDNSISFIIDCVMFSYEKSTSENKAFFLLNESGFKFVQDYYNLLIIFDTDEQINISEYRKNESTYPVIDAECCPHFVLQGSDSKNSKEIIIHKTPYLKWHNFHCENDVIKYNRWICKIVSFYYLTYIDFTYAKIECNNQHTIIYKRSYNSTLYNNDKISYYSVKHLVNSLQNIDSFINKIDFKKVEESYQFVEFLIDKFFQSTYLENATKYLVLYNIIEICFSNDSRQSKKDIRVFHDPKNEIKKAYKESLKTVIKKVESDEKEDFKKTWESLWRLHRLNNVSDKIITYLGSKGLSIENINKHIVHFTKDEKYNITLLRNEVTHEGAGFKNFDFNGINQIASLIVTTLILHILGIDNIDLYHNIDYHDIIIKST